MTITQVLAFYAPFAGLLLVVFWLGILHQRVRQLEERVRALQASENAGGMVDRMARLEVHSENTIATMEKIEREMAGLQRQMGNVVVAIRKGDPTPWSAE